jgi:hypothetical protein
MITGAAQTEHVIMYRSIPRDAHREKPPGALFLLVYIASTAIKTTVIISGGSYTMLILIDK